MTNTPPPIPVSPCRQAGTRFPPTDEAVRPLPTEVVGRLRRGVLVAACLSLVVLIALLDRATDSHLSFSLFYLIPVAACAWLTGFPHGTFVSLAASVAWHLVDCLEDPATPPVVRIWNGVVRFGVLALASSMVARMHAGVRRDRRLARTDPLTGAANSRTFYETVVAEADRASRTSRPLTLAYFDLDDFKPLNDRLGHAVGDAALRCVVHTAQLHLRGPDLLARLGGDEFALLLPETGPEGAAALLTRLLGHLSRELSRKGWPVTLSVGAATFLDPVRDVDLMLRRADALMYAAKKKGKGRVEHAIVQDALDGAEEERQGIERRGAKRVACNQAARVRREGQKGGHDEFAVLCDISVGGIGLRLVARLPEGALVLVEPLASGAKTFLARVLHAVPDGVEWRHGCELPNRLSAEDLRDWLGQSLETTCR